MSLDTVYSAVSHAVKELHSMMELFVFQINSLPPELLPKIFKHLNIHDRKNVRLTCRLWNEFCNVREITKYEKFVFHPSKEGCGYSDLGAHHIEECEALGSCLEFQGLPLWRFPSTLWANIGQRVQSLFIHQCSVDDATILNIIIHCINLKTLHLQSAIDSKLPCPRASSAREFFTEEGIDELIRRKIERRNLTSLILYSGAAKSFSTRELRKLFQIFPLLQKLDQGVLIFVSSTGFELRHLRKIEWVFPPTMENVVSNVEDDGILNSLKRSNSKLKEFRAFLDLDSTQYDLFLDFCSKQKELEKLALDVGGRYDDGADNILFLILKSFPKLKELELHIDSEPEYWYSPGKLSELFVMTAKLESIYLNFRPNNFPRPFIPLPAIPLSSLSEYSTLKSLTVSRLINPKFIDEILRRCRTSLHHLKVMEINDEILELILETHTELRTLCIDLNYRRVPYEGGSIPKGKIYPFRKLKNLVYLRLVSINQDILKNNISELIFPNLRYLEFDCSPSMWRRSHYDVAVQNLRTMLRVVCKGAPYLKTLKINASIFKSIDLVDLLRNVQMKFLRYITIHSLVILGKNQYTYHLNVLVDIDNFGSLDAVFNACPSLFSIRLGWDNRCTYVYNRHLKYVERYSNFETFDSIESVRSPISCLGPSPL